MRDSSSKLLIFFTSFGVCIMAMVAWQAVKGKTVTVDSGRRQVMGTFAHILAVGDSDETARKAIAQAFAEIVRINEMMNDYDPNSLLSQLSRTAVKTPVVVDEEIFAVLEAAVHYSERSDGKFDVTIGPESKLWRQAKKDNRMPDEAQLRQAKSLVGYQKMVLDSQNRTVMFEKEGMSLDLGGIAKGFAIDKAVQALQNAGMVGGMVDIGGDLRCFGVPANKAKEWLVGLQDPTSAEDILMVLKMNERAVATSGDYQRFVVIDGQKHSHIIDPGTADGATVFSSVSVIAPNAMDADALATAVSILGKERGVELIESIPTVEAFLIEAGRTQNIIQTTAAAQYIQGQ